MTHKIKFTYYYTIIPITYTNINYHHSKNHQFQNAYKLQFNVL